MICIEETLFQIRKLVHARRGEGDSDDVAQGRERDEHSERLRACAPNTLLVNRLTTVLSLARIAALGAAAKYAKFARKYSTMQMPSSSGPAILSVHTL